MRHPEPAPGLHVRSLSKAFGSLQVLDDLTLDFDAGKVTALLGPNGAGKTTLLKAILGLVHADEGIVEVGRHAIDPSGSYRQEIGFMPQLPRFPARMSGRELADMLDDLRGFDGAPDLELVHAFGLEADLDKPFGTLSGGTRQKVNAALAFRYRTPVLILDEPTAGLDPVASLALKEKVRRCREDGRTIVVTSHKLGDLQSLADDVVFLHEGRARFRGSLAALLDATGRGTLEEAIADLMTGREMGNRPASWPSDENAESRPSGERAHPGLRLLP